MKYSIFALFLISIFGFFNLTHAQVGDSAQTIINLELVPENPRPGNLVYASLSSYATDINRATITWKLNGSTKKSGVGEKNFSFTTGAVSSKTTLLVTIKTVEGEMIEKNLVIRPSEVDMIWQSRGYVPPFYKGKSMFSHQNQITFIAIPHISGTNGAEIGSKNLIYKWKKNGSAVEEASGYGKNSYTFTSSIISRPLNIEVEISSMDGESVGYGQSYLEPQEPSVVLYKKDPVYGIEFQRALQGTARLDNSKEVVVVATPFFFGTLTQSNNLSYKWLINGVPIGNDPDATTQVFRQKKGTSGVSKISVSVENSGKILQSASESFNLMFENKNN